MPRTDEATEATLTIEPPPFSSMPGRNARIVRCIDLTLRSNEKSQSPSEHSSTLPWCTKPTQLKRTSIGPISRASASTASLERTSSFRRSPSSPCSPARSTSVAITRAPSAAKASAVARPMPAAAAVSNAVLPFNRNDMLGSRNSRAGPPVPASSLRIEHHIVRFSAIAASRSARGRTRATVPGQRAPHLAARRLKAREGGRNAEFRPRSPRLSAFPQAIRPHPP